MEEGTDNTVQSLGIDVHSKVTETVDDRAGGLNGRNTEAVPRWERAWRYLAWAGHEILQSDRQRVV